MSQPTSSTKPLPTTFDELLRGTLDRQSRVKPCEGACGRIATHSITVTVSKNTGEAAQRGRTPARKITSRLAHYCEPCAVKVFSKSIHAMT